jgi:hypothetical protein
VCEDVAALRARAARAVLSGARTDNEKSTLEATVELLDIMGVCVAAYREHRGGRITGRAARKTMRARRARTPSRTPPPPPTPTPTVDAKRAGDDQAEDADVTCAVCLPPFCVMFRFHFPPPHSQKKELKPLHRMEEPDRARGPRLPCGHKVTCVPCTYALERCPFCRLAFGLAAVGWSDDLRGAFVRPPSCSAGNAMSVA